MNGKSDGLIPAVPYPFCALVQNTEIFFVERDVRYIAINDGVDSAKGDNDFTPFRNLFKNTRYLGGVNC